MAVNQIIWSLNNKRPLSQGSLVNESELEALIYNNIEIIDKNLLAINHQIILPSGKILDILCMDPNGDLTVIELKKDMTPRDVVAQILDYASCVSKYSFADIAERFDGKNGQTLAESFKAKFGTDIDEDNFNINLKMIIVASKMDSSTERIIDYLRNTYKVNINILFFSVYNCGDDRIISRVWHEEPNDEDFIIKSSNAAYGSNEYYVSYGINDVRTWEDAVKYGFISAGGGLWYTKTLKSLTPGNRVWVNIPGKGYTGVGIVTESVCIAKDALFDGKSFSELDLNKYLYSPDDDDAAEYIVKVNWLKTVDIKDAVKEPGFFGNQNSVCLPHNSKWEYTLKRLREIWKIKD